MLTYGGDRYKTFDADDGENQPVETSITLNFQRDGTYHKRESI